MRYMYDVAVLGGGASGLAAAAFAGLLGAKVALVEPNRLGGECTWSGCIPSKTLLHLARSQPRNDFAAVMDRVRTVREEIYAREDAPPNLARYGVEHFRAAAQFADPHTIVLDGEGPAKLTARWIVVATGSRPKTLSNKGDVSVLNNESIFELQTLPRRLLVAGAGPVGIELAQAFVHLGCAVTVVAPEERILTHDDEECAAVVQRRLAAEGITFILGASVAGLQRENGCIRATLSNSKSLEIDAVFAGIGREARTQGLGLEAAGVIVRDGKISVDSHMRTTQRNIYAVGDVATNFRFTHIGERTATIAVSHALLRVGPRFDEREITWATFTAPELAFVGITEAQARKRGMRHQVFRFPYEHLDRATTDEAGEGLVKVVAAPSGRILGAAIVGSRAGDMIAELALACKHRIKLASISQTLHVYPTYALGNRRAADSWLLQKLSPFVVGLIQRFRGLQGERRR